MFTGKIDLNEMIQAFHDLGVDIGKEEAKNLLLR